MKTIHELLPYARQLSQKGELPYKLLEDFLTQCPNSSEEAWVTLVEAVTLCMQHSNSAFKAGVLVAALDALRKAMQLLAVKSFAGSKHKLEWKLLKGKVLARLAEVYQR